MGRAELLGEVGDYAYVEYLSISPIDTPMTTGGLRPAQIIVSHTSQSTIHCFVRYTLHAA